MSLWTRAKSLASQALKWSITQAAQFAGISVRIDDSPGWGQLSGGGPADRSWSELAEHYNDVVVAWRLNAWVRQVVRLTTAYVVGDGVSLSSKNPEIQNFIDSFVNHPENHLHQRLESLCDELTRAGELYPVLFTNKFDGMSQIRLIPASCILEVLTDPDDYEKELGYKEQRYGQNMLYSEPTLWKSWRTARAFGPREDGRHRRPDPLMLHYTVNRLIGATRGESDLTPLLPWANRYTSWLKERALFNRIRNSVLGLIIRVQDPGQVEKKKEQYRNLTLEGGVLVLGPDEEVLSPEVNVNAIDTAPDGKALRLAMATASNQSLTNFGEGDTANLGTSHSMDDRTYRFYRDRRKEFGRMLVDLIYQAYRRQQQVRGLPVPNSAAELQIIAEFPDISRSDNKELGEAARSIVQALGDLKHDFDLGPTFDEQAIKLAFKFAGEVLEQDEIETILAERGVTPRPKDGNGRTGNAAVLAPAGDYPAANGRN